MLKEGVFLFFVFVLKWIDFFSLQVEFYITVAQDNLCLISVSLFYLFVCFIFVAHIASEWWLDPLPPLWHTLFFACSSLWSQRTPWPLPVPAPPAVITTVAAVATQDGISWARQTSTSEACPPTPLIKTWSSSVNREYNCSECLSCWSLPWS